MPQSADDVRSFLQELQSRSTWQPPAAFGLGIANVVGDKVLDTYFGAVNCGENLGFAALAKDVTGFDGTSGTVVLSDDQLGAMIERLAPIVAEGGSHPNAEMLESLVISLDVAAPPSGAERRAVVTFIGSLDDAPVDTYDVYLRLHLLSSCKVKPHGANLDGIFGLLNNVVWTDHGPFDPDTFEAKRASLRAHGVSVSVSLLDKFPPMVDYVIPAGVRIADASRVRLGAHLAPGTTVMHEGFVNFNAGTLGNAMVEGRISAGVVVDSDTDLGGGASIMGTLSGGGKEVISIGKNCLIGANAGVGISLGDGCIVEAGLYITAGTIVALPDGTESKARELSGQPNLLYRRNSRTGRVEAIAAKGTFEGLNEALHAN